MCSSYLWIFSSTCRKFCNIPCVRQVAVAQGSSHPFCTEVFQMPSVAGSKRTSRRSDGQGLCSWFAVGGCWGCRFSQPLTVVLRFCDSVPIDATTGNRFGDRPFLGGNPVNSVCS